MCDDDRSHVVLSSSRKPNCVFLSLCSGLRGGKASLLLVTFSPFEIMCIPVGSCLNLLPLTFFAQLSSPIRVFECRAGDTAMVFDEAFANGLAAGRSDQVHFTRVDLLRRCLDAAKQTLGSSLSPSSALRLAF